MNEKIIHTLELNKIKMELEQYASSSLGKEQIEALTPLANYEQIVQLQNMLDEATHVIRLKGHAPLSGIFDVRPHIKRAEIGGILNAVELSQIARTLYASRQMKNFVEELLENEVEIPFIENKCAEIIVLSTVEKEIKDAVDENGDVLDSASPQLRTVRQKQRRNESRIRERLEQYTRSQNASKMLSDAIITIRNERYVIPVKQEYRSHYGGIVHDQSSSGQTLFIEPQAVVELNNELKALQAEEKIEIERILAELTNLVAEVGYDIIQNMKIMGEFDFLFAKARYSKESGYTRPIINNEGYIQLIQARHPLIPIDEVVKNDIEFGREHTTIVITGPNTGGKTITLKTVGLCTLMAQSGLYIPAAEGSEVAVFKEVFADIGDEQSIEQSLSTFSSHMVNIVDILQKVDHESLVLFDELGSGTDPQEGSALAISILDDVYNRGARVIATTHYPELKAYGYNREGVMNASVEFSVETLRPTYRLLLGVPGRSNAFEISKRLGLDDSIIQSAKSLIDTESNQVENMIASLERSRKDAENEYKEAHDFLKTAEQLHKDLQKQMVEFYQHKDSLYEQVEKDAEKIIEKAKEEAEEVMKELRKMRHDSAAHIKEHELIDARRRLDEAVPKLSNKAATAPKKKQQRTFAVGDEVKVLTFGQKGQLIEKVNDTEWQVQVGIMKMTIDEKELEFIKSEPQKEKKTMATLRGKDFHVGLELDLRGERYEDALVRVEKYIDDALLANHARVSIIHGKGTGALRTGVTNYLKRHRSVKRIRLGDASEGGSGVTIVEFK